MVIPHFPQLEAEIVNTTQCSPEAEQFPGCFAWLVTTRMKFDHELFDVTQTPWISKYRVERRPLGTLDVNLQNINRRLCNIEKISVIFATVQTTEQNLFGDGEGPEGRLVIMSSNGINNILLMMLFGVVGGTLNGTN